MNVNDYLATVEQLSYARPSRLIDGPGAGQRIIDICNGVGLHCTVTPDRGLNIVECTFKGIPMVFRTRGGHRKPTGDFLHDWSAGLFTTCGLHNIGVPSLDEPLHGRISQLAAEKVNIFRNDAGGIVVTGSIQEGGCLFRKTLVLDRVMTFDCGRSRIEVCDTVTNCGSEADDAAILYHCNFGYPFISPDFEFDLPEHKVEPRDEEAASGLADWMHLHEPVAGYREQCFRHFLPAGPDGMAVMKGMNRKLGVGLKLSYDTSTLPLIVQWKNCGANEYVLGLEPSAASLNGREADIASGMMPKLEPGERIKFHVEYLFEEV